MRWHFKAFFLVSYFIGNISAKKYQNPFTCVEVIASRRWDVFLSHGVRYLDVDFDSTNSFIARLCQFWYTKMCDLLLLPTSSGLETDQL